MLFSPGQLRIPNKVGKIKSQLYPTRISTLIIGYCDDFISKLYKSRVKKFDEILFDGGTMARLFKPRPVTVCVFPIIKVSIDPWVGIKSSMIWLSLCNVLFFTKFKPQNLFPCVQVSIFLLVFVVVVSILKRYGLSDENKKKVGFLLT